MPLLSKPKQGYIEPWVRVFIMLFFLALVLLIAKLLTGSWMPQSPPEALIFQNALLLIVLGSALLEYKFTKPADSVVNGLTGMITLITVYQVAPRISWWFVFGYCLIVFILASVCTIVSIGKGISGWRRKIARYTYAPAVFFGKARLLFSIIFLYGLIAFFGLQSIQTITLVIFWGIFIAIWPLGLPELLSGIKRVATDPDPIANVLRTEWPNIVRVVVKSSSSWDRTSPKVIQRVDGDQSLLIPLYSQVQGNQIIGTGLCITKIDELIDNLESGFVYDAPSEIKISDEDITQALGGGSTSKLIGFVIEESTIPEIRFETLDIDSCREGMLVWCQVGGDIVYYQITKGLTREEAFLTNRQGFQVATAAQLGVLDKEKGFIKHLWLPAMNTPVFAESTEFGTDLQITKEHDFIYGILPGSSIKVGGPLIRYMDFHTAILGMTGSGKTELAFDIIRHAISEGIKVICVDLTAKYEGRLADLSPSILSLSPGKSEELEKLIFAVDSGEYKAGKEKRALKAFVDAQRDEISKSVSEFLISKEAETRVGIIALEEISNTKATLYLTELFLTCLLHFAKDEANECPRVLIVVEEAHTVMPEPGTVGIGDFESKGLVSKIAQIALQGRKYDVGLLVIAQRTATVSKTVLTQCNTIISFSCIDNTSLDFLKNVFGQSHISLIPDLPPLHAVIFGKGMRSERPLIIEIPYIEEKAKFGV